ncbi:hypothetical protein G7K_4247-t1 [Saitoella complicata NRRL Y-17804]|uniref:40S ribosomal protein S22 n=1 Tax=Saitoella complicata (strain BCRC 22490 / CBS 7301 / JCM 7358 / NBRC 10748 / NRRL Y-17804) TaxID=698492 RepID=A0A0E9NJQ4_SAICN|nr:hypothetical protein G7K_4247-t1 [Saitoella complicata NRRL Y-17804]
MSFLNLSGGTLERSKVNMRASVLNDCLNNINNAEKRGKRQVLIRPSSKVIIKFLSVMQKHGYIGEFEEIDDHRSGKIVVQLNGRLNKCGVISPRFNVRLTDMEKWVSQLLPSRQFGYMILTTSAGIMDHEGMLLSSSEKQRTDANNLCRGSSQARCRKGSRFLLLDGSQNPGYARRIKITF